MVMFTDISQVMDLHNHLSSLGLMVGSVSHGIKGLLTGLDGGVYLLNSGFAKENKDQVPFEGHFLHCLFISNFHPFSFHPLFKGLEELREYLSGYEKS